MNSRAGNSITCWRSATTRKKPAGRAGRLHRNFENAAAAEGSEAVRLALLRRVRDQIRGYWRWLVLYSIKCKKRLRGAIKCGWPKSSCSPVRYGSQ
jgi:hypothetical protein